MFYNVHSFMSNISFFFLLTAKLLFPDLFLHLCVFGCGWVCGRVCVCVCVWRQKEELPLETVHAGTATASSCLTFKHSGTKLKINTLNAFLYSVSTRSVCASAALFCTSMRRHMLLGPALALFWLPEQPYVIIFLQCLHIFALCISVQ